jgi:hypothetical protein
MSRRMVFDGLSSLETMDLRLSPSSLSLGAPLAPPVFSHHDSTLEDLLPDPELAMMSEPTPPSTPTSGPSLPGSS